MQQLIWGFLTGLTMATTVLLSVYWLQRQHQNVELPQATKPDIVTPQSAKLARLRKELPALQAQIDALQAELLQASLKNDEQQRTVERSEAEKESLRLELVKLNGRADLLEEQLTESNYQKRSLMIQLQDSDVLLEQLENMSHENRLLRERLDEITSVSELPYRLEEVLNNLSETKQVLESAMEEFGGLHTQIDINHEIHHLNSMFDRPRQVAGTDDVALEELRAENHELEHQLARLSRIVSEVWQKYRTTIKRMREIAGLETENHKLYLQLKVSNTKIAILRDRLAAAANRLDDLSLIKGVTPMYKMQLRQAGIETFADLAVLTSDHIIRILRVDSDHEVNGAEWISEARRLAGRSLHLQNWLLQQTGRTRRSFAGTEPERPQLRHALDRRLSEALGGEGRTRE